MSDSRDGALITRTLGGDEAAFAELVRRYRAPVARVVYRTLGNAADTEDALQEVFLRLFISLARFDVSSPVGPWLFRIANNFCIDQLRRRRRLRFCLWTDLSDAEQQRALSRLSRNGDFKGLLCRPPEKYESVAKELIEHLKPTYRVAFVLREIENRSYEDIAALLGTSQLTARVRVSRARTEIRRKFESYLQESERVRSLSQ